MDSNSSLYKDKDERTDSESSIDLTPNSDNNTVNVEDMQYISQLIASTLLKIQEYCQPIISNLQTTLKEVYEITAPLFKWVESIDYSAIYEFAKQLSISFDKYKEIVLQTMYEAKWFPYVISLADFDLMADLDDVIKTSKKGSKRREQRIDKLILTYFTDKRIKELKKQWYNSDLDYCIKKSACQSLDAYMRKEYALTISCLATMWEGLIFIKAYNTSPKERHRQNTKVTKENIAKLTAENDYDKKYSDFFDDLIVNQCNSVDDVLDGVPNRHGVAHSWYKKYPNKKTALNAILITDYFIKIKPLNLQEESTNGQT